jgi:hypothetical protein
VLTIPAALATWLAAGNNVAWRADLLTITLQNGTVYRWSTADMDLTIGGNTWSASGGGNAPVIKRGSYAKSGRLQIDTLDFDLGGPFTIGGQLLSLFAAGGGFFGATIQVDHLIGAFPGDVGVGGNSAGGPILKWFLGGISSVSPKISGCSIRCKSALAQLSAIQLPRFVSQPQCNNSVYDPNCGLVRATFTLSGSVTGVATKTAATTATAAITAKGAGYFNLGVIQFTSGATNGYRRAIEAWTGSVFFFRPPLPTAPSGGDTFTVYPGCDKAQSTCQTRFANTKNFRGYPYVPAPESAQ